MTLSKRHLGRGNIQKLFQASAPRLEPLADAEERILAHLLEATRPQPSLISKPCHRRLPPFFLRCATVAVAMVLLVIAAWFLLGPKVSPASASFADVLKEVSHATSVSYEITWSIPGQPDVKEQLIKTFSGRRRTVCNGKVFINDECSGKVLILVPAEKRAVIWHAEPGALPEDPVATLMNLAPSAGRYIETKLWDSQKVEVYRVVRQDETMDILVDPQRQLPVRIEVAFRPKDSPEDVAVLENFRWNEPVDCSLLSMEPPPDYVLQNPSDNASQASLLDLLRTCAEKSGGRFPEDVSEASVVLLCMQGDGSWQRTVAPDSIGDTFTHTDEDTKQRIRACLCGLAFIERVNSNGSWKYLGKGVALGEGSVPIAAWKQAGSDDWTVVYGDLKVKPVPDAEFTSFDTTSASGPAE